MGTAIGLRDNSDVASVRRLSRLTNANQTRRLLFPPAIYDCSIRSAAPWIGGVGFQIVWDWVLWFNSRGPDGLPHRKAPGPRLQLNDAQRRALVDIVERGPIPAIHDVMRRYLIDLVQWLHDRFAVSLNETNVRWELKKLCYAKLTARLRHQAQNEHAMEALKKRASLPSWQRSGLPS